MFYDCEIMSKNKFEIAIFVMSFLLQFLVILLKFPLGNQKFLASYFRNCVSVLPNPKKKLKFNRKFSFKQNDEQVITK